MNALKMLVGTFAVVLLGAVPIETTAQSTCGDCSDWIEKWPLKAHTSPSDPEGGNDCSEYECHESDKAGSCIGYHPSGCGVALLPSLESAGEDEEMLEDLLAASTVRIAEAPQEQLGVYVLACDSERYIAWVPLSEEATKRVMARRTEDVRMAEMGQGE